MVFTQLLAQLPGSVDFFVPLAVNIAGLWLAYRYVPSARVDPKAALIAAAFMGIVLELVKIIFSFYVVRLSVTVQGIYGAIAFIPLSLFWLYLLWVIFLFGVELTYTMQNLPSSGCGAPRRTRERSKPQRAGHWLCSSSIVSIAPVVSRCQSWPISSRPLPSQYAQCWSDSSQRDSWFVTTMVA